MSDASDEEAVCAETESGAGLIPTADVVQVVDDDTLKGERLTCAAIESLVAIKKLAKGADASQKDKGRVAKRGNHDVFDLRVEDQAHDTTSKMGKSAKGQRSVWRKFVDNVKMWRRSARGSREERR